MARTEKVVDWDLVDRMLEAQATAKEIAGAVNLHLDTFYYKFKLHYEVNFADYALNKSLCGKALLRLSQFQKALNNNSKGNTQMLIWLGKNLLGQTEQQALSATESPKQDDINKDHLIMKLQYEIEQLKQNAHKPEAE